MSDVNPESSRQFTLILVMFILLVIVGVYYQNPSAVTSRQSCGYYGSYYYGPGYYGGSVYGPYAYGAPISTGYWW